MNKEQLDCLHIECKQLVDDGLDFLKSGITYGQALEIIEALKEAQQDAERYRWLRECDWEKSPMCVLVSPKQNAKLGSDCPSRARLDEFIDEAMHASEA